MKCVVPLTEAHEVSLYGSKAVGLGDALRQGLPVPPGVALSGDLVEAIAAGDEGERARVLAAIAGLRPPFAVRSSAVDEDSAAASFAGQHLTVLNVQTQEDAPAAVREVWWSANSDSAITYRQRLGLFQRPSVGVVIQSLLRPTVAGVMFTENPVTGADERLVEASWGLGEAVVAGKVIPDNYRIARTGEVLERRAGHKHMALRPLPEGGTVEEPLPPDQAAKLCLDDAQLAALGKLAEKCEQVYGRARDIEFAFEEDALYLLQCRAVTTSASGERPAGSRPQGGLAEALPRVQLFSGLDDDEVQQLSRLFKERRFAAGETVMIEGTGGATFFVIQSGEAVVSIRGERKTVLGPGDHFGELALIDGGSRTATVTAASDLVCQGLTFWEFRPLVESNPGVAWKLLVALASQLRELRQGK